MKSGVVTVARDLGFDGCRVGRPDAPESADLFRRWLAEGRHGTMGYMERTADRRLDPRLVLPGVRSVVVLAISYHRMRVDSAVGTASVSSSGVVARYARFEDYHDVVGPRVRALAEYIDRTAGDGTRSLAYVDTGPILEREFGQRAGLGFIGKHTNLIGRELGNWFFLAVVLTTAEIEPDAPERNRCGTCERCLRACPTGAITAPFELDARRCISYLTIELKGSIPEDLRPAIGARIFGCDDCLEACPWNRFAREGRMMDASVRAELGRPNLEELLALDEAGFRRRFAGTPMVRAKRRGFLRNVCVALGNVGGRTALGPLAKAAADSEPLIAEHARWAMERIQRRSGGIG